MQCLSSCKQCSKCQPINGQFTSTSATASNKLVNTIYKWKAKTRTERTKRTEVNWNKLKQQNYYFILFQFISCAVYTHALLDAQKTTYGTSHDVGVIIDESQSAEIETRTAAAAKTLRAASGSVQQPAAASIITLDQIHWLLVCFTPELNWWKADQWRTNKM